MRPNLMSPRRTSGEDSILAMLERDPARKRVGAVASGSGARMAWYGASATVAIVLTGVLVWLAAGNTGLQPVVAEDALLADAGAAARPASIDTRPTSTSAAPVRQVAMTAAAAPPALRPVAAVVVDEAAGAPPPMRLLKPAPSRATEPVRVPVRTPGAAAPARPLARSTAPAARPATSAPAEVRVATRPAARAPAPARAKPLLAARNAVRSGQARVQRPAAPPRPAEGQADADVALISAVILHANGHAPEGSQMTELLCPNDACQAKPARQ